MGIMKTVINKNFIALLFACLLAFGLAACSGDGTQVVGIVIQKGDTAEIEDPETVDFEDLEGEKASFGAGLTPVYGDILKGGSYETKVLSSSTMFCPVKAVVKVEGGKMTAEITMENLGNREIYPGSPEEASKAEDFELIKPQLREGEEVFVFEIEALDKVIKYSQYSEGQQAWVERAMIISSDGIPADAYLEALFTTAESLGLKDGSYKAEVELSGGTGKAYVESPCIILVAEGKATALIRWSSDKYDYMVVGGEKILPMSMEGGSTFEIPVKAFDYSINVKADTTAMSTPHEIDYNLCFISESLEAL